MKNLLALPTYPEFRDALRASGCTRCDLAAGRTNLVVDRGNPEARILAVGEGPGADEDATGTAFVGRGGKLLDRLFAGAGFDTNVDLLIANVVKCRPPGNRAPRPEEADACRPFLARQIELVAPEAIVLLGASALKFVLPALGKRRLGDLVGREITDLAFPGVRFLVLYHPAYLLRDPRKQPLAREHLAVLRGWFPA